MNIGGKWRLHVESMGKIAWLLRKIKMHKSWPLPLRFVLFFPVKPFASEHEFRNTAAIVKRFASGIGQHLHQRLLQRAKSRRNWVILINQNLHLIIASLVRLNDLTVTWYSAVNPICLQNDFKLNPIMSLYEIFPVTWMTGNVPAVCVAGGMVVGHGVFGNSNAVSA